MRKKLTELKIGIIDADLLDNGTRHPNLALLKISGLLVDNGIIPELVSDSKADLSGYDHIFMSRVFTFTHEPECYLKAPAEIKARVHKGGTGYYATETNVTEFRRLREEDMTRLDRDEFLNQLPNRYGLPNKPRGIDMARQMPYYDLYKAYVTAQIDNGTEEEKKKRRQKWKDYLDYSIGFLTRKCYRHCPFCVNRLEHRVEEYSRLEWFHDKSRPHVFFWDDNFLASDRRIWHPALEYLIENEISFQFRQGLDERQFAENPDGEEMAEMLSRAKYHGDYIFAFDNWKDRKIIRKALKVWKRYNPDRPTKFYLFCGFHQTPEKTGRFYTDIWEIFQRIRILMQFGCIGYLMRHEDYHNAPLPNIYVQIARWCNQPAFYKKMSFWEYCYRNQSYWEEKLSVEKRAELGLDKLNRPELKTFDEFMDDVENSFYDHVKMCLPLKTLMSMLEMFPEHRSELLEMFNFKLSRLRDPSQWEVR